MGEEEELGEEYWYKIVVIGDIAAGKSNLLSRFARNLLGTSPLVLLPPLLSSPLVPYSLHWCGVCFQSIHKCSGVTSRGERLRSYVEGKSWKGSHKLREKGSKMLLCRHLKKLGTSDVGNCCFAFWFWRWDLFLDWLKARTLLEFLFDDGERCIGMDIIGSGRKYLEHSLLSGGENTGDD